MQLHLDWCFKDYIASAFMISLTKNLMILLGLCEQFEKGDGAAANVKTHKH